MKTTLINILAIIGLILCLDYSIAQTFLTDGQQVPVFEPAFTDSTDRKIYWDLAEINGQNGRLDVAVGVTHYEGLSNFINGNWYMNENNSNFNDEVIEDRFIYLQDNSKIINGFIFKLNDSTKRRDPVVTRGNDELERYFNSSEGITGSAENFFVGGKVQAVGQFTNDIYEDAIVLSHSGDTIKIYKSYSGGQFNPTVFYRYFGIQPSRLALEELSNYIYPYSVIENTVSDREDLIYREGQYIKILKNSNDNYFTPWISINTEFTEATNNDFKVSDFNNDGLNDIVVVQDKFGIKIYKNSGTGFSLQYSNLNYPVFHPYSVSTGDFNKDGFNDLSVIFVDRINIYLNLKTDSLFSATPSSVYYFDFPIPFKAYPINSTVADLYNKGGLAVMFSASFDNQVFNLNTENLFRVNATDTDAVPAPPHLFESYVQDGDVYHPQLLLYDRDNRDFQKFRIYKYNWVTYHYYLFDSTTNNQYIDSTEDLLYVNVEPEDPPEDNLFYYAVAVDSSYKVSITSDTISYIGYVCPTCQGEIGPDNIAIEQQIHERPGNYSIGNYPNPFNPVTTISYALPEDGQVKIVVYNSLGMRIKELVNERKTAGRYELQFNGLSLPSGVYFYVFEVNGIVIPRRMILIK